MKAFFSRPWSARPIHRATSFLTDCLWTAIADRFSTASRNHRPDWTDYTATLEGELAAACRRLAKLETELYNRQPRRSISNRALEAIDAMAGYGASYG
jgi:hypothetical protein